MKTLSGHNGKVSSLVQLKNGYLASSSGDKTIKLWELSTGQTVRTLEGHLDQVTSLVELNNGQLASGSTDKSIIIWG